MAVDASKLKRRRSLGAPPTEGAPGIEAAEAPAQEQKAPRPPRPPFLDRALAARAAAQAGDAGEPSPPPAAEPTAPPRPEPVAAPPEPASVIDPSGAGEGAATAEPESLEEEPGAEPTTLLRRAPAAVFRSRGGDAAPAQRQRVPPPETEPRLPFTTRVTLSTKERLEDACYHLRRRHQDFINEAILMHLKKHGF